MAIKTSSDGGTSFSWNFSSWLFIELADLIRNAMKLGLRLLVIEDGTSLYFSRRLLLRRKIGRNELGRLWCSVSPFSEMEDRKEENIHIFRFFAIR